MRTRNARKIRSLLTALFTTALVLAGVTVMPRAAAAADTVTVNFDVQYMQTNAREMLADINTFRTGDDAWYWNSDDTTKTTLTDLGELAYDYDLEKVAMLRAAEIAYSYGHTRPANTTPVTAYSELSYSYQSMGENIATGYYSYTTAAAVLEGWKETDENYSGQGHRRNLLSSRFNRIGIAGVKIGNTYYWVQEFAYSTESNTETTANDVTTNVAVTAATSDLTVTLTPSATSVSMEEGASKALPTVKVVCKDTDYWPSTLSGITSTDTPEWSVADTSVARLSGTTLQAVSAGTTTLTATIYGTSLDIPVNVTAHVHSYTSTVTKAATCGTTGVRTYTCSCGNTYTETIAATGAHTYNSGTITKAATCAATGVKTYTCTVCGATKTETIAKTTNHTWTYVSTARDNCESTGTATYKCSVCGTTKTETVAAGTHTWNSGTVTKAATCAATGVKTYTCTVCGATKTETIAKTTNHTWTYISTARDNCESTGTATYKCSVCGTTKTETVAAGTHTWNSGTVTKAATCAATGVKTYTCTVCYTTKTETIAKTTDHTYNDGVITKAPTCGASGEKTWTCTVCGSSYTRTVEATGDHTWSCTDPGRMNCEEEATATYTCTVCGKTKTETVAAGEHTWNSGEVTTEPTYDHAGVRTYTCTVCGTTKTENIPALTRTNIAFANVVFPGGEVFEYSGSEIRPEIQVWYSGEELTEGSDYEAAYADNIEPGTATVTITGLNGFEGSWTTEFSITKILRNELFPDGEDWMDYGELILGESYSMNCPESLSWNDVSIISENTDIVQVGEKGQITASGLGNTILHMTVREDEHYFEQEYTFRVNVSEAEQELLEAPSGLTVVNYNGFARLSWTWDPAENCDDYHYVVICSNVDPAVDTEGFEETYRQISVTGTYYDDDQVESGVSEVYMVWVDDANGNHISEASAFVVNTYLDPILTTDLTVANATTGITVKWPKIAGAEGYIVYRKATGAYSRIQTITSGTTTSYTDTAGLSSGTTYSYAVRPYCNTSMADTTVLSTGYYGGRSIRYLSYPAQTVVNTSTGITISWKKSAGATGYIVYRKYGSTVTRLKTITSVSTLSYTDTAIASKNGYAFSYAVVPYYGTSSPVYGAYTWRAIYRLTTPAIKTLKNAASKSMTATWAKNATVTGYQFQYALNKTFTSGLKTLNVAGAAKVTWKFASLTKGKTYYLRMRVYKKNSAGAVFYSGWSSVKSVKIKK